MLQSRHRYWERLRVKSTTGSLSCNASCVTFPEVLHNCSISSNLHQGTLAADPSCLLSISGSLDHSSTAIDSSAILLYKPLSFNWTQKVPQWTVPLFVICFCHIYMCVGAHVCTPEEAVYLSHSSPGCWGRVQLNLGLQIWQISLLGDPGSAFRML